MVPGEAWVPGGFKGAEPSECIASLQQCHRCAVGSWQPKEPAVPLLALTRQPGAVQGAKSCGHPSPHPAAGVWGGVPRVPGHRGGATSRQMKRTSAP
eukprot:10777907-Alexandrium_andersonii.AAC.1